jgi:hypothetical protein
MSTGQQQEGPRDESRQGGVRIETELWVRVIGRDTEPIRRSGNICGTGFFFEAEDWVGRPGDIGVMEVCSDDRAHSFTTMASLKRVVSANEARFGSVRPGVSYQFLPSDELTRTAIARTVRHIAEQHPDQAGGLVFEDFQQAASEAEYPGAGQNVQLCVETGARVRLVVDASVGGSKREVTGVVGDITESVQADGATRFWVPIYQVEESESEAAEQATQPAPVEQPTIAESPELSFGDDSLDTSFGDESLDVDIDFGAEAIEFPDNVESPEESDGDESLIDRMWKELVPEARSIIAGSAEGSSSDRSGKPHLSGRLSQISMPSALWLLDQEHLSGALEFRRDCEEIVLYLEEGRVIDAESPDRERTPREHLSVLMSWEDGQFEFHVEAVDRPDRLGVPTQGLLLDLAVADDEAGRR